MYEDPIDCKLPIVVSSTDLCESASETLPTSMVFILLVTTLKIKTETLKGLIIDDLAIHRKLTY